MNLPQFGASPDIWRPCVRAHALMPLNYKKTSHSSSANLGKSHLLTSSLVDQPWGDENSTLVASTKSLERDEEMRQLFLRNVRTLGYAYLKPPGFSKTLQACMDEEEEEEDEDEDEPQHTQGDTQLEDFEERGDFDVAEDDIEIGGEPTDNTGRTHITLDTNTDFGLEVSEDVLTGDGVDHDLDDDVPEGSDYYDEYDDYDEAAYQDDFLAEEEYDDGSAAPAIDTQDTSLVNQSDRNISYTPSNSMQANFSNVTLGNVSVGNDSIGNVSLGSIEHSSSHIRRFLSDDEGDMSMDLE